VLTNLIHDVDLLRWWIGEIVEARGFQSNRIRGYPVDETCAVAVRFDNGVLGTLNISDTTIAPWSWEHTTGENPVYPATDQTCYHLAGTRGALAFPRLETWSNAVPHGWHQPFMSERLTAPRADALALQLAQFARVVRGEEAPLVSAREGLATLAAIDLVQRAMGPLPQAAAP
jgi:predicted dehydrogenase